MVEGGRGGGGKYHRWINGVDDVVGGRATGGGVGRHAAEARAAIFVLLYIIIVLALVWVILFLLEACVRRVKNIIIIIINR